MGIRFTNLGSLHYRTTFRNNLIYGNSSYGVYVYYPAFDGFSMENCTIIKGLGGGLKMDQHVGPDVLTYISSCIIYSNAVWDISQGGAGRATYNFCCVGSTNGLTSTGGNTTNNPLCVDMNTGNYRLSANSPGVNAGTNEAWMINAVDLDGYHRIDRFSGRVDMGAYEYLFRGTIFSVP